MGLAYYKKKFGKQFSESLCIFPGRWKQMFMHSVAYYNIAMKYVAVNRQLRQITLPTCVKLHTTIGRFISVELVRQ